MSLVSLSRFERVFDRAVAPAILALGGALTFSLLALGL